MKKFIGGCLVGWIGTLIFYFFDYGLYQPENTHTLGYFVANDFHQALPFIFGVPGVALGVLVVYVLFTTFQHADEEIRKKASMEGEVLLSQIREKGDLEVEAIRARALTEASRIKEEAQKEAVEIKREALALKNEANLEWDRIKDARGEIDEMQQDLSNKYQEKRGEYLKHIKGLEDHLNLCKVADEVRDKIIFWLEPDLEHGQSHRNLGAAERFIKDLHKLQKGKLDQMGIDDMARHMDLEDPYYDDI